MICEQCRAEGKKSTIYAPSYGISTAMGDHRYYDEDGKYHVHDPNSFTQEFRCSNGHQWSHSSYKLCPSCDYNAKRSTPQLGGDTK